MHYYQFNVADYRKDTSHLKPIEHYIYRTLLDWCYMDECGIPKETQVVMRRLSLGSDSEKDLINVLSDYFIENENEWIHPRVNKELSDYKLKAEINRVNGRKGGRPKKQQVTEENKAKKTHSVNSANPSESELKPNYKPLTNNQELITNVKRDIVVLDSITKIFEYWKQATNSPRSKLDDKRKKLIRDALKLYSPDEIEQAVTGCTLTPHNMGQNDRHEKYLGLHIILKSADQIDRFISNSKTPPKVEVKQTQQEIMNEFVNGSDYIQGEVL